MTETDRSPTTLAGMRETLRAILGDAPRKAVASDVALLLAAAEVGGFALALEIARRGGIHCPYSFCAIARELGLADYQPHAEGGSWGDNH